MKYCIELVYETCSRYLSVKGRSEWSTKRIALKHAKDIRDIKATDGIKAGLVGIVVWLDDRVMVERYEVQS